MLVVETGKSNRCVKFQLPNGKVVDVLTPVLDEISKWIQDDETKPESGGYIVGYQHEKTGNISLEAVSHPYSKDIKNRVHFIIRDPLHNIFLKKALKRKSYYMGVWHTHPQNDPIPSRIDWEDWEETLYTDQTGSQYVFFIVAGIQNWRLWIGDMESKVITEGKESPQNSVGIYSKESEYSRDEIQELY